MTRAGINAQSIREVVAAKVAASCETVFEAVAQVLATEEIEKRSKLVLQYYTEIDNGDKELKKLKSDLWNGEGFSGYTKDTFEKRGKVQARIAKVEAAIFSALTDNDFGPLKNLGDNKDVPKA